MPQALHLAPNPHSLVCLKGRPRHHVERALLLACQSQPRRLLPFRTNALFSLLRCTILSQDCVHMLISPAVSVRRAIFIMSLPHKQLTVFLQSRTSLPTIAFKPLRPLAHQPPCSQRATHPALALPLFKAPDLCNSNSSSINTVKDRSRDVAESSKVPKKPCKKCPVGAKTCCPRLFTMAAHNRPHLLHPCPRVSKLNIPATLSHILTLPSANHPTSPEPHVWTPLGRSTANLK